MFDKFADSKLRLQILNNLQINPQILQIRKPVLTYIIQVPHKGLHVVACPIIICIVRHPALPFEADSLCLRAASRACTNESAMKLIVIGIALGDTALRNIAGTSHTPAGENIERADGHKHLVLEQST